MVRFIKIDSSKNMARFYNLYFQPTLFGDVALVREWGRLGGGSQRRSDWFPTEAEALAALERASQRREQRGYQRVA
jgi:predicted DNA-binding WGR domain protein